MSNAIDPIPADFGALVVQLVVDSAGDAIAFYKAAFGADELYRQLDAAGTKIVHCELLVGLSRFIVHDEFAEAGLVSPHALGGTPATLMLYVEAVDAAFDRAVAAGAAPLLVPEDRFWGVRSGLVLDPFGHRWLLASRIEDLSPSDILDRARAVPDSERAPLGSLLGKSRGPDSV